jgi:hypothetical protein
LDKLPPSDENHYRFICPVCHLRDFVFPGIPRLSIDERLKGTHDRQSLA